MLSYLQLLRKNGLLLSLAVFVGNAIISMVSAMPQSLILSFTMMYVTTHVDKNALAPLDHLANQHTIPSANEFIQGFTQLSTNSTLVGALLILGTIFFIISLVTNSFQFSGAFSFANQGVQQGRATIDTYFMQGLKLLGRMALLLLLISLPYIGIGALFFLFLVAGKAGVIIAGVGIAFCLILSLLVGLAVMHAPIILISERTGIVQAVSLSTQLFRKSLRTVFSSGFSVLTISLAYFSLFILLTQIPTVFHASFDKLSVGGKFLLALSPVFFSGIFGPIVMAVSVMLITYRYHKYLRQHLIPQGVSDELVTP